METFETHEESKDELTDEERTAAMNKLKIWLFILACIAAIVLVWIWFS